MVQWSCEVPPQKVRDFVRFAKEKLKPFHEAHGCKRLEVFMPMELQKKYFPYQVDQRGNRYIEQLIFEDLKDFESFLEAVKEDPRSRELLDHYGKEFNVFSCSFRIFLKKV